MTCDLYFSPAACFFHQMKDEGEEKEKIPNFFISPTPALKAIFRTSLYHKMVCCDLVL